MSAQEYVTLARVRSGRGEGVVDYRRRLKDALRDSWPRRGASRAAALFFRGRDIETWPFWLDRICEVASPKGVVPMPAPSPRGSANINILFEALRLTADVPGDVAECGVFRGRTLVAMAVYLQQRDPRGSRKRLYGFDSFQGFDTSIAVDLDLGGADDGQKKVHGFDGTSTRLVLEKLENFGVEGQVELVPGYFQDSLPAFRDHRFSFVHLDCDIYESYRTCLEFFYPRLSPGGIALMDEYQDDAWPGCTKAVDEFLADKPERLQRLQKENYVRAYFVKGG